MATGERSARARMVQQLEARGIRDRRVLEAMRAVPRSRFVDEALAAEAYVDSALPIGDKQTISQPWIVARMCELLEPDGNGRVLEIGTGSGYHAAVLSHLFEKVYTVERIETLSRRARATIRELEIQNVHFKVFDGTYGWSEFAPYRGVIVTAAAPELPRPLLEQLAPGGRLVAPLSDSRAEQTLVRITTGVEPDDPPQREEHGACRFVPLIGRYGWAE